jgi:predicted metal-dependent phosphoesterase TrpH
VWKKSNIPQRYAPGALSAQAPTFDLQSHSLHSDGALAPHSVVATAAASGVELLALTDHDTVDGVEEAARAARDHGLTLVPAVEISATDRGEHDLHVLGFAIDHRDAALAERLRGYRADRERRARTMAAKLRELGFGLEERVLTERETLGKSIGRPHLAEAVVTHPANAERLAREGIAELSAFLEAYLVDGRPAFVPRAAPSVAESIDAIHAAGGVAVWAHPFWHGEGPADVLATIERFQAVGLDGVECFYKTHSRAQTELVADRCAELGLLITGSSDFHGPAHRVFSRFRAFSTYGRAPVLGPIAGGVRPPG